MEENAAGSVPPLKHKRCREDLPEMDDGHSPDYEEVQNPQKRFCHGLLSELFCADDAPALNTVHDEMVLPVMKNLEEEMRRTSEIHDSGRNDEIKKDDISGEDEDCADETGDRISSYDYLASATDLELGIPPSPTLDENYSRSFWSDLFENPLPQNVDLMEPFLSHCYSFNYEDCVVYTDLLCATEPQEWMGSEVPL